MRNFLEMMHPSSLSHLLYGYSMSMRLPDVLLTGKKLFSSLFQGLTKDPGHDC